jgi:uroporphyrinogen III methyltransferase/synthase
VKRKGLVILAGAGPGDPGLATVALMRELPLADVVVYDYLANEALLKHAPQAKLICVGKRAGEHSATQPEINALLVKLGTAGKRVLRLKGGDPFVFGRGGEEALALRAAKISFEVVPGVTSGIAALAYAGIPLTHRGLATASVFVTGQEKSGKPLSLATLKALARLDATLVFYMATAQAGRICQALIRHGLASSTPAALVHKGTFPGQRVIQSSLGALPIEMKRQGLGAPGLIVVGAVAGLRPQLRWFEERPLFGRRIVVTRAREQASRLAEGLIQRGAEVLEAPSIKIKALPLAAAAIKKMRAADWLVVTSSNGAELIHENFSKAGLDMRALSKVKIAAIGASTAAALRQRGLESDLLPGGFVAEALAAALIKREGKRLKGARVLIARAQEGREALASLLEAAGAKVEIVALYKTLPDSSQSKALNAAVLEGGLNWVTFTSSSTVKLFEAQLSSKARSLARSKILALCMGPVTTAAALESGYQVALTSSRATIDDFLDSIEAYARGTH